MGWNIYTCWVSEYSLRKMLQYEEMGKKNNERKAINNCRELRVINRRNEEERKCQMVVMWRDLGEGAATPFKGLDGSSCQSAQQVC